MIVWLRLTNMYTSLVQHIQLHFEVHVGYVKEQMRRRQRQAQNLLVIETADCVAVLAC